jgi:fibronectin-binding autotransporter adhesin
VPAALGRKVSFTGGCGILRRVSTVRSIVVGTIVAASLCALCGCAEAQQVFTWTNGEGSLNWTDSNNWSASGGNAAYPGFLSTTDTALFTLNSSSSAVAVTLGSMAETVGQIVFSNTGGGFNVSAGTINLSAGGLITEANTGKNLAANQDTISAAVALLGSGTISNNNPTSGIGNPWGGTLVVSGPLSGTGPLTVSTTNSGLVQLTGNNSGFTGLINVVSTSAYQGGVYSNATGNFGNSSAVSFTNGLWELPAATTVPITINAGQTEFSSGAINQGASITVNSGGTLQLQSNGNAVMYSGPITGQGALLLVGKTTATANDCTFTGGAANTISGPITIQSGRLILNKTAEVNAVSGNVIVGVSGQGAASVLWSANDQVNGAGVFTLLSLSLSGTNYGSLWMQGRTDTIAGLQDTGGSGTAIVQNQAALTNGALTVLTGAGSSYTFGGTIRDGSTAGMGTLSFGVAGAGRQTLTGAETYSGATTVSGGTLTANGSLATANIQVNGGSFNGSALISFQPGNEIVVGATGSFDASGGMTWNLAGLNGSPVSLLDFTSGGRFISPASLNSLLTPSSAARYSLSDVNNVIEAMAQAAWSVDASSNWNNPANWSGGNMPDAASTLVTFGSAITQPRTITLDIPVTLGSIAFNNTNQYTLVDTTGANSITLNSGSMDSTINVTAGSHVIAAAVILAGNGVADVSVTPSSGTLTISGNISAAAGTTSVLNLAAVSTGTLLLTGSSTLGSATVGGGDLQIMGGVIAGDLVVDGGGRLGGTGTINLGFGDQTLDYASSASSTFAGTIVGGGGLLQVASGVLTLNGTNSFTGGTLVDGGLLILTSNQALAGGTKLVVGDAGAFAPSIAGPAAAVPEPSALALLAIAATAALGLRWRPRWRPGVRGRSLAQRRQDAKEDQGMENNSTPPFAP